MKSIDHYLAIVPDQEAARRTYLRLGFNVRPTARHIEFGSTNAVVIFPHSYLELLHLADAKPLLKEQYAGREAGLTHVSLTADSLAAEWTRLECLGYTPGPEGNARRKVVLPDGSTGETDSSFLYNWKTPNRYLSLFHSEHRIPEMIFIEGHTDHANGAIDIARIVGVSPDPAQDLDYYEKSWGHAAEWWDDTGFGMRGGRGDRMDILTEDAARARYPGLLDDFALGPLGGVPLALHYRVKDRAGTRRFLAEQGIAVTDVPDGIAVAPADAEGVLLVFE